MRSTITGPRTALLRTVRMGLTTGALAMAAASIHGCELDVSESSLPDAAAPTPDGSLPQEAGDDGTVTAESGGDSASEAAADGEAAAPSTDAPAPVAACSALPGSVVYIESGDTQENLLKRLGRDLRDNANITLAFVLTGSCALTNDAYSGASIAANTILKYVPSTAENPNWDPSQPEPTCTTGASGAPIDVAISALLVQSCGFGDPPSGSGLALIQGPNQAYTFVVPTASDQTAIWAQEAYYAFGFGNNNPLGAPWNNEQFLFIRPTSKSTLVATAFNIELPPAKWKGVSEAASGDVVNAVTNSAMPEATLGILGAEVYDGDRGKGIKTLAFQAYGQSAAYYPDSTATAFDKQNLRDGHYTLWSPTVYLTNVDGSGVPTNPSVKYLIDLVLGAPSATPPDGGTPIDGLAEVVKVGLIPQCAMKVSRTQDGGDLSPYTPAAPCTCYYLSHIAGAIGAPAGCTACAADSDCGDGGAACVHGFCEPDAAEAATGSGSDAACFAGAPTTHDELINACTDAQSIEKPVTLPGDGGLEPLP